MRISVTALAALCLICLLPRPASADVTVFLGASGTPTHRTDAWRGAFDATSLFGPLEERSFPNEQVLDADGLEDRVGSISFIASLPEDERATVLAAARGMAADGPVRVPYRTDVHISRRA